MFTDWLFRPRKQQTARSPINKFDRPEATPAQAQRDTVSYIVSKDGELIIIEDVELLNIIEEKNAAIN